MGGKKALPLLRGFTPETRFPGSLTTTGARPGESVLDAAPIRRRFIAVRSAQALRQSRHPRDMPCQRRAQHVDIAADVQFGFGARHRRIDQLARQRARLLARTPINIGRVAGLGESRF